MKYVFFLTALLSFNTFAASVSTFNSVGSGVSNSIISSNKAHSSVTIESHQLGGVFSSNAKTELLSTVSTTNQASAFTTSRNDVSRAGITRGTYVVNNASVSSETGTISGLIIDVGTVTHNRPRASYVENYTTTEVINGIFASTASDTSIFVENYLN